MGTRIKICGIRDVQMAQTAAAAGASWVGLVFAKGSPRQIEPEKARELVTELKLTHPHVHAVGLFVNEPVKVVKETARFVGLEIVQLHGQESAEYIGELRPLKVIKAVSMSGSRVESVLDMWRIVPDAEMLKVEQMAELMAILVDSPAVSGEKGEQGGSGRSFDWSVLVKWREKDGWQGLPPLMLAGGLTVENVGRAIRLLRPWAVDVSSGVESVRGMKDPVKVEAFCRAVAAADEPD